MNAQMFAVPSGANIIKAWQYDEFGTQQWIEVDFGEDGYWVPGETVTQTINGREVSYQTYIYNIELVGMAMPESEYWRFELEVSN